MLAKKLLAILKKRREEETKKKKEARITIAKLSALTKNATNSLNMLQNVFKDQIGDTLFHLSFVILVNLSQQKFLFENGSV